MVKGHRADRQAWQAAAEVAHTVGVELPADAVALGSTNHVWLLDEPALALNVAAPGRLPGELADRLVGARFLADLGVFAALTPGFDAPVETAAGRLVTVWDRVDIRPGPPRWAEVGGLLRRIAEADVSALGSSVERLRKVDDLTDIIRMIDELMDAQQLTVSDAAMLHRVAGRLAADIDERAADHPRVVVHGDLWPPNLLVSPAGMVLCDADEVGTGPGDWDLAALLDWGRLSASGLPREQLLAGWSTPTSGRADEPAPARIRCLTRVAHLRRTLRLLTRRPAHPRDRYWDAVRIEGWRRVDHDWCYQAFPELHLSRPQQLRHLVSQTATLGWRRVSRTVSPR